MSTEARIAPYNLAPAKVFCSGPSASVIVVYVANGRLGTFRLDSSNRTPSAIWPLVLQCLQECHSVHKIRCASPTLSSDQGPSSPLGRSRVQGLRCRADRGRRCTASRWISATRLPCAPRSRLSLPAMPLQNDQLAYVPITSQQGPQQ